MPRLRPRVEIQRVGRDKYKVHAAYGTQIFANNVMNAADAQTWLWQQITTFWARGFDVDYFEEIQEEEESPGAP